MSKYRVTIDLDFDEAPDYVDVENYLGELLHNDCLNYTLHTSTSSEYCPEFFSVEGNIKGAAYNKTTDLRTKEGQNKLDAS